MVNRSMTVDDVYSEVSGVLGRGVGYVRALFELRDDHTGLSVRDYPDVRCPCEIGMAAGYISSDAMQWSPGRCNILRFTPNGLVVE